MMNLLVVLNVFDFAAAVCLGTPRKSARFFERAGNEGKKKKKKVAGDGDEEEEEEEGGRNFFLRQITRRTTGRRAQGEEEEEGRPEADPYAIRSRPYRRHQNIFCCLF